MKYIEIVLMAFVIGYLWVFYLLWAYSDKAFTITVRLSSHDMKFCISSSTSPLSPLRVVKTVVVNVNSLFERVISWRQVFILFYDI
jgi:hypothetical protein